MSHENSPPPNDKVVRLVPENPGDNFSIDADQVLASCLGEFRSVVVIGLSEDGELFFHTSHGRADILMMLERVKAKVLSTYDD